jgi:amino acid adenylation domain-containing protein
LKRTHANAPDLHSYSIQDERRNGKNISKKPDWSSPRPEERLRTIPAPRNSRVNSMTASPFLLQHLLSATATRDPERPAVYFDDQCLTFGALEQAANKLAHQLIGLGARPGTCVGMHLHRGASAIIAAFGILKTGAAYVPIDPGCPPSRLGYIVTQCNITTQVTARERLRNVEQSMPEAATLSHVVLMDATTDSPRECGPARVLHWPEISSLSGSPGHPPEINQTDTDLAYILFTSGSTGRPKGVMITHRNSLTFINAVGDFFKITAADRFSHTCPMHFDMSVFDLFVAFRAGAAVVVIPESLAIFPVRVAQLIVKQRITVWNSVPSALVQLAGIRNLATHDFSHLRLIAFAGEVFPLKFLRLLRTAIPGARYCNMYGQTEANSSMYYWVDDLPEDSAGTLPIGRALPNFEIFALQESGQPVCKPGEEGELYVRASTVASGYLGNPEKTAAAFVLNPLRPETNERVYRTGDLVRLGAEGNYFFAGRKDHMIKSRGYRIEIGEIETILSSHPSVAMAVVIPIPDENIGHRITAMVVLATSAAPATAEDLLKHCGVYLPRYMIPESLELREKLPVTSSGKVDRSQLAAGFSK